MERSDAIAKVVELAREVGFARLWKEREEPTLEGVRAFGLAFQHWHPVEDAAAMRILRHLMEARHA